MVRREQFVNDSDTTLNGAINDTTTSITVTDGSVFPSSGDFRILIDDEILLVTARSTNTLTVVRGAESTTAASHSDAAVVTAIVTADALDKAFDDIVGGYSDRYPYRILNGDTTLSSSDFTWVNQSTATIIDETWGGLTFTTPAASNDNHRILVLSAPSTPYTLTAFCLFGPGYNYGSTGSSIGILQRDSTDGKLKNISIRIGDTAGGIEVRKYNSPTSFNSEDAALEFASDRLWLQLDDDGTDVTWLCSADGINFYEVYTETTATFWTSGADQLGMYVNSYDGSAGQLSHFLAWIIE